MNGAFFLAIMLLTFYAVFHGQDYKRVGEAFRQLSVPWLLLAALTALFFVSAEGCMIWYLLWSIGNTKSSLGRCIVYSFIGFFYSGITPSATGGQPMQLYYMKKDGNSLADSSVVLMTVALIYKFVLVIIGGLMLVFWLPSLKKYLQGYLWLYCLGLMLNALLVAVIFLVMAAPGRMKRIICAAERLLSRIGILQGSAERKEKIGGFMQGYRETVGFFRANRKKLYLVIFFTFLQRASVFLLTALIYRGFSLRGTGWMTIMLLQASLLIAVDMLPLPGAQGITEFLYCRIFGGIFTDAYLMPSLYVTRGINFYFLLLVSLTAVLVNQLMSAHRPADKKV